MLSLIRYGSRDSTNSARPESDVHEVLLAEPGKELDEKERASAGPFGHLQHRPAGLCPQHIGRHLRDPSLVQRTENNLGGAMALQVLDRGPKRPRSLTGAKSEDPGHRNRGQPGRQRPQSGCRPAVGPLQVIKAHQQRRLERGPLEQCLQILQQPVSLLRRGVRVAERGPVEDRRRTVEQGLHQRRQLDHAVAEVSHAATDPDQPTAGHGRHLLQQAALAHPGAPLNEGDRTYAGKEPVEMLRQGGKLRVAAADRLEGLPSHGSDLTRFHYRPSG